MGHGLPFEFFEIISGNRAHPPQSLRVSPTCLLTHTPEPMSSCSANHALVTSVEASNASPQPPSTVLIRVDSSSPRPAQRSLLDPATLANLLRGLPLAAWASQARIKAASLCSRSRSLLNSPLPSAYPRLMASYLFFRAGPCSSTARSTSNIRPVQRLHHQMVVVAHDAATLAGSSVTSRLEGKRVTPFFPSHWKRVRSCMIGYDSSASPCSRKRTK